MISWGRNNKAATISQAKFSNVRFLKVLHFDKDFH